MEILTRQFGLLIAYLLPGFVTLAGIAPLAPTIGAWLRADQSASFGAPLYALLAATAAGMVVSCFRWLIIDPVIVLSGVTAPAFNAKALEERPAAFNYLVENHYRFYQFYANTFVAVIWSYSIFRTLRTSPVLGPGTDLALLVVSAVLFAGSRDAINKYRDRSGQLIRNTASFYYGDTMTNGIDHHQGQGQGSKPPPQEKSEKPKAPTNQAAVKDSVKTSKE